MLLVIDASMEHPSPWEAAMRRLYCRGHTDLLLIQITDQEAGMGGGSWAGSQ